MNPSNSNSRSHLLVHQLSDANASASRRLNKIVAVAFTLLIISISTLLVASSVVHLFPTRNPYPSYRFSSLSAAEDFCCYSNVPLCVRALNGNIISDGFAGGPDQIFSLSLQTAAKDLRRVIDESLSGTLKFDFRNCSDSLRNGLGRIGESLAIMRARRPFFGPMSDERRDAMVNRVIAAEEDVGSCLDDLAEVEPPETVAGMTAELAVVKVYLHSAYRFVVGSARTGQYHFL